MLEAPAPIQKKTSRLIFAALFIAAIMFAGFAKNYYLRTWLGSRPITFMVHIHGLVMTAWVALFLTQTLLIAKNRTDLHRKLGVLGGVLAGVIVALGSYTIYTSMVRQHLESGGAGKSALVFVSFDGVSLLLFGGLVFTALRVRLRPHVHKRLMLMAMISLLPPAFGRLVAYFTHHHVYEIVLALMYCSVVLCVLLDTVRHHRLQRSMVWSGALVIAVNQLTYLAQTAE